MKDKSVGKKVREICEVENIAYVDSADWKEVQSEPQSNIMKWIKRMFR